MVTEQCVEAEHCIEAVTEHCVAAELCAVVAAQTRMASDLREELNCSVCLNIFSDPVMLSCGHNFCRVCIGNVLDTQDGAGVYTCPECRAEFTERPALQRNMKLCNIVERFLTAQPEKEDSGIFCTYCIDAPVPAAKTCLLCEASLCDRHLSVHSKSTEHVLTEPISSSEKRKCSVHKEALKYYCPQDAVCVCVSCCLVGEHRGHQVCSMDEAMEKKKEKMKNALEKMTSRREETEKRVQWLEKHKVKVQDKAAGLVEQVTGFFQDIREKQETLEGKVLNEISRQEEQISLRVSDLIKQMKKLPQKMNLLKDLCKETDPLTVLQDQESEKAVSSDTSNEEEEEKEKYNKISLEDLDEFLISLGLHKDLTDIIADVTTKSGFHVPTASNILLNVNTAANDVSVSSDLKTASAPNVYLQRPRNFGRFQNFQVFSTGTFASGRHYWEVEISNSGTCRLGVSYPSVEKSGQNSYCGNNIKSWCLRIENNQFSAIHNSQHYVVEVKASCRFGIFLDYEVGRLSFYELCNPSRHIYTFTSTFTEPLHAAFIVSNTAWVKVRS
uniref:Uncharacterized protein n=1 Tax=Leptobrachium leishanense TaxID=445787 RepID=A0A8C5PJL7_9ANUR